jgi:ABC-2 type transport system ATP-binding protein
MITVLEAENVSKHYSKNKVALDCASLNLYKGEILGLLGPNGAGKTTFIKILATLLNKTSGTIDILGYNLDDYPNEIRHLLGYVGQDTERSMYARLTPVENLRFFGRLRGLNKDHVDNKIHNFIETCNIQEEILDKQFMHLSGGQKQTVVIMRALLHDPPIIYLDEPTKGLDPFAANSIREFLKLYVSKGENSLILTSHILSEVDYLSDRCSLINQGKIPITDTSANLKKSLGATEFVELNAESIDQKLINTIQNLDSVITYNVKEDKNISWLSFGVNDLFDGTEEIIKVLRNNGVKTSLRHHSVSLEDAFIHHIGAFRDEVK